MPPCGYWEYFTILDVYLEKEGPIREGVIRKFFSNIFMVGKTHGTYFLVLKLLEAFFFSQNTIYLEPL